MQERAEGIGDARKSSGACVWRDAEQTLACRAKGSCDECRRRLLCHEGRRLVSYLGSDAAMNAEEVSQPGRVGSCKGRDCARTAIAMISGASEIVDAT